MAIDQRSTWLDDGTGLVHGVSVVGAIRRSRGTLFVESIATDCGIKLPRFSPVPDRVVTCVLCIEGYWVAAVTAVLGAARHEARAAEDRV